MQAAHPVWRSGDCALHCAHLQHPEILLYVSLERTPGRNQGGVKRKEVYTCTCTTNTTCKLLLYSKVSGESDEHHQKQLNCVVLSIHIQSHF